MSSDEEKHIDSKDGLSPVASITPDQIGSGEVITTIISPGGVPVEVTGDVDEAMKLALVSERIEMTPEQSKALLRKIDRYLLPLCCFLYSVQFMDKVSNGNAAIMGLKTDLDMATGDKYTWVGSAFYLGYLAFEFPVSAILQRFPLAKTTAIFIFFWGVVLCLHATPNYAGFIFLRTLLGALESSVTPAMMIITSQWYRKEEQFFRTTIWFGANGWGTIMGSSIAYGIALRADKFSIAGWKILFIVTGLMTVFLSVVFWSHIPDSPAGAWFLTEEEKLMVVERIRTNNQGFGNKHFKKKQFIEALTDYRTWLFFFFALFGSIPNGGITNFGSILMTGDFGYSTLQALKMGMIGGAVEFVGCPLTGSFHGLFKHRFVLGLLNTAFTFAGACMLAFANNSKQARLAGYFMQSVGAIGMITCISLFSSNVAGHTKKVTVNAIYLIGYCVGNLIGPQTFRAADAPGYTPAKITIAVCVGLELVLMAVLYWSYWYDNRTRAATRAEREKTGFQMDVQEMENMEFADLTDKENPHFVYAL